MQVTTHTHQLQLLADLWFQIRPRFHQTSEISQIIQISQDPATLTHFNEQDIDFDGLVIKVNDLHLNHLLGETAHHPRWAMAYKFPAQQVSTPLLSIDRQVGRTGIITPVANVEPVAVSGVMVARVSLHNTDFIHSKDIRLGDYLLIQRSGEVIPYVIGPVLSLRSPTALPISIPTCCPICQHPLMIEDEEGGGYLLYCTDSDCTAQIQERLKHFVSRDAMDIEGLGESIITLLVEHQFIHHLSDIYHLTDPSRRSLLTALPGLGDKKIQNIISAIETSKSLPLRRLLHALGIRHIGKKTAQLLAEHYVDYLPLHPNSSLFHPDVDRLIQYGGDREKLSQIYSVWPETIVSSGQRFADPWHQLLLQQLHDAGVQFSATISIPFIVGPLSWIHFAITGLFERDRDVIIWQLVGYGAIHTDQITKKTTHLIVGDRPSSKLAKAEKLQLPVISWIQGIFDIWWIQL